MSLLTGDDWPDPQDPPEPRRLLSKAWLIAVALVMLLLGFLVQCAKEGNW